MSGEKKLRRLERDVLIAELMRKSAKSDADKCQGDYEGLMRCMKDNTIGAPFLCRKEKHTFQKCMAYWFTNAELYEECKQKYITERRDYHTLGKSKQEILQEKMKDAYEKQFGPIPNYDFLYSEFIKDK